MNGSEFLKVVEEALETLAAFSIPIYRMDHNGRPILHGTGFFVTEGGAHFLVSAAHVLDHAEAKGLFYYAEPSVMRKLSGQLLLWPAGVNRQKDQIDVGVLRLTSDNTPPYPAVNKYPMLLNYLVPEYLPRAGRSYAFVGFPGTRSKTSGASLTVTTSPYAFRCSAISDHDYAGMGLEPRSHVALRLDLKEGYDPSGNRTVFPKPQGMSGAPIVVLYNDDGSSHSKVFPVVAVATTYRVHDKVVFGTDASYVLDAIKGASGWRSDA